LKPANLSYTSADCVGKKGRGRVTANRASHFFQAPDKISLACLNIAYALLAAFSASEPIMEVSQQRTAQHRCIVAFTIGQLGTTRWDLYNIFWPCNSSLKERNSFKRLNHLHLLLLFLPTGTTRPSPWASSRYRLKS
jgi:hypothetical protein